LNPVIFKHRKTSVDHILPEIIRMDEASRHLSVKGDALATRPTLNDLSGRRIFSGGCLGRAWNPQVDLFAMDNVE
jgi:hypothetical protein